MEEWFHIDKIDKDTYIISEYRHWEQTHCYLLNGTTHSLLIDTGLGIGNLFEVVKKLSDRPVIVIATHIHWDHIGAHKDFPVFYAHAEGLFWLQGEFPQSIETVRKLVMQNCKLPIKKIFPAHFSLDIEPMIIKEMSDAFQNLKNNGKLHHGSGVFAYEGWKIQL